mgnify:CR=1 FL=1
MQVPASDNLERRSPFSGFLPFFWLALCAAGGMILSDLIDLPVWIWIIGLFVSLTMWVLALALPNDQLFTHQLRYWTRSNQKLPGMVLAAFFFFGACLYSAVQPVITPAHAAYYNDRGGVQLVARVIQPPDSRDTHTNLTVEVESLTPMNGGTQPLVAPEEVSGRVLLQVQPGHKWHFGDRLQATGQLQTPFEGADFSYRDYLAHKGIFSTMSFSRVDWVEAAQNLSIRSFIYSLREKSYTVLQKLFPPPESDLLAGILLGIDQGLSPELQAAFQRTGTSHIIAISGFNFAILAGLFSAIFTRFLGHKWGAILSIIAITGYTVLVGGSPAVVRAAIMGGLGVLGGMFGRRQNGLNSLGIACLVMILLDPNLPWDLGFQLSVAATLGLVLFAQPMEEKFLETAERWLSKEQSRSLLGPVSEIFLFSIAAQVMTIPIIAYHFGGISWLAFVANPLILPPQSLVMVLGGLALLAGLITPGLGQVFAVLALPFVRYTIRMVEILSRLSGEDWTFPDFHSAWLIVFYAALFVFTLLPPVQRKDLRKKFFTQKTAMLVISGLVIFVWNRALTIPDGKLHLTLLDQAGTVLIQSPHGQSILVGGGSSPSRLKHHLGQMLPVGNPGIDVLVVGSAAREDLNGLSGILETHHIEMALWGAAPEANQASRLVYSKLVETGVPITPLDTAQSLELEEGMIIRTLWTDNNGALLWLTWDNFSALIPTGKIALDWLVIPEQPDVVLLMDDVSVEDPVLRQIMQWSPAVILLTLEDSELSLDGHHELLDVLAGYPVMSTLQYNWVQISTDGAQMWVNGQEP